MSLPARCQVLRIYIGDKQGRAQPLFETIVMQAKRAELAGVSVFRGVIGFGHKKLLQGIGIHSKKELDDLPVMIEIIDTPARIEAALPEIVKILGRRGLVTLSDVTVVHSGEAI